MTVFLKKGSSSLEIKNIFKKLMKSNNKKGMDASKYCGKISLKVDALIIQKNLRDEWR